MLQNESVKAIVERINLYPDFQNDLGARLPFQTGRSRSTFTLTLQHWSLDIGIGKHHISNGSNQSVIAVDKLT
jgi:hypothetical protein